MINLTTLDANRIIIPALGDPGDATCGAFVFDSPSEPGTDLRVIASSGDGWDHCSVSCQHRTPTWAEMEYIKRKFWKRGDVVMQLHVGEDEHINCHPNALHMWKPHGIEIPMPPREMV